MKKKSLQSGYSLLELLIYLALFIVISVVVIHSLVVVMRTYAEAATYRTLQTNGELAMERMVREVRQASALSSGSSTLGTNPGVLALSGYDSVGTSHTVSFSVSGSALRITDNGVSSALTTADVSVSNIVFRQITTAAGSTAVKIELTLTTTKGTSMSTKFYSTVILRGK